MSLAEVPVLKKPVPEKPRFKRINGLQFCSQYRIEENIGNTSRVEGPKYISNYSDGTGKVLRVIPATVLAGQAAAGKN